MSNIEVKSFITPLRDTANTYPHEIDFTLTSDGKVIIALEDRHITFSVSDLKTLINISSVL